MRPIDADNLISVLDILCDKGSDIRYWEQLKMIVEDCPTIEQCGYWDNESNFCTLYKPASTKHGWWVEVNDDDSLYRCSACGELSCCNSPYCGECGAKMDEVSE